MSILTTAGDLHVAFRVGNADYAVPANEVLHLEAFETATPVPGAPSFVAGLVHVRSRPVPVVDLRARFGLPPVDLTGRRIIVCQVGARVVGLLVDAAREVIRLDPQKFEKPPELVDEQASGFVRALAVQGKRLVLLIDVSRVIGEEMTHGQG